MHTTLNSDGILQIIYSLLVLVGKISKQQQQQQKYAHTHGVASSVKAIQVSMSILPTFVVMYFSKCPT